VSARTRLGISVGDPAGIGPEVVAAALRALLPSEAEIFVYGDVAAVERAGGLPPGVAGVHITSAEVRPGRPDPAAARGVVSAIQTAARACLAGELDALVTAPISKEVIGAAGFPWPGHTELLEETCKLMAPPDSVGGSGRAVMLLVGRGLRVGLATIHCALREVPGKLNIPDIAAVLGVMHRDLERRFALRAPRIAVCGLNPHAGEAGRFGDEEERVIAPAIARARADGVHASGPHAADSLFHRAAAGEFDAVLAMYHDQGLGPLKTHAFGQAVNVTLGLPIVRTSVDHGTAFDIAGQGRADPGSMIEAVRLALDLSRNEKENR
jgi:4-hydroxythreonine-4-phosphate dehydrogenase